MRPRNLVLLIFAFTLFGNQSTWALNMMAADTAFIRTYGGINFEEFRDIVQTPDSGFMMAGITNGYGQGSNAIYVVKTTKDGTHMWSRALGGAAVDLAYSISADASGNYYIAGTSSSGGNGGYDGYLVCLNVSGNVLWEKYYGGTDWDFINAVKVMPDQSILLAGESYTFSDGGSDAWVLHLNSVGDTLWTKHFGSTGNDAFKDINVSSTAIYLSGYVDSTDANGKDGYVVKLNIDGSLDWEQRYNNLGRDLLNGSVFVLSGDIIIYGSTAQFDSLKNDSWLSKIDTNGTLIWTNNSGSIEDDDAKKILALSNNELLLIGQKNPSGNGAKSIFMGRFDSGGFLIAGQSFGGANDEDGYSMIHTMEGGVAIVGSTTSFGVGNNDALLVFLQSDSSFTASVVYNILIYIERLSPIGIEEFSTLNEISISPNPSYGSITISSDSHEKIISIEAFDFQGRKLDLENQNFSLETQVISISNQPAGIYFLKVLIENGKQYVAHIIKLK